MNLFFVEKIQKINLNHYYKIYSKFVDRFLIQIRGLFCGQTLTTFCGQTLSTDSWTFLWTDFSVDRLLLLLVDGLFLQIRGLFCGQTFLWTDSCYFSVDRLLLLFVDRLLLQIRGFFCGQTCWSCWQNLWTDFSDKFWTDFVDKFVHVCLTNFRDRFYRQKHKFGYRNFVDRICRQICTALTNIFSTHLLKRISKIFFSARGRNLFFVGQTLVLFWQTCWKEYRRFSFQQGGEKDRVNPQGKISNF